MSDEKIEVKLYTNTEKERALYIIARILERGFKWFTKDFFFALYKREFHPTDTELRSVDRLLRKFAEEGFLKREQYRGYNKQGKRVWKVRYHITDKLIERLKNRGKDFGEIRPKYEVSEDGEVIVKSY